MSRLVLSLALICLATFSAAKELVPLLAWSNSDSLSGAQGESDVERIITQIDTKEVDIVVVLKSGALSFDDLAKYGGVYGEKSVPLSSLQDIMNSAKSSLSTGVTGQAANDIIDGLSFAMGVYPDFTTELPVLSKGDHTFVVVELPQGNSEETFRAHDATISKTITALSKVNYIVFYTADHASSPTHRPLTSNFNLRSASGFLPDDENNGRVKINGDTKGDKICYAVEDNNSTCLLFCLKTEVYYIQIVGNVSTNYTAKSDNSTMGDDVFRRHNGTCNITVDDLPSSIMLPSEHVLSLNPDIRFTYFALDVMFSLNDSNSTDLDFEKNITKTIVFLFPRGESNVTTANDTTTEGGYMPDQGFWTMQVLAADMNDSNVTIFNQYHAEKIYSQLAIPLSRNPEISDVSYACGGNNSLNRFIKVESNISQDTIQLTGIQVQPYAHLQLNGHPLQFGSAYNCNGYFDFTTLMGVVSVLILLIILYLSTVFIFSIQTIDRFDDPRGETIKVENLH